MAVVGPQVAIGQTIYSWTSSGYKIIKTWRELSCNVNVQWPLNSGGFVISG